MLKLMLRTHLLSDDKDNNNIYLENRRDMFLGTHADLSVYITQEARFEPASLTSNVTII